MPKLVDAYLQWRYPPASASCGHSSSPPSAREKLDNANSSCGTSASNLGGLPTRQGAADVQEQDMSDPLRPSSFTIDVYDIFTTVPTASIPLEAADSPAEALVQSGYLGATPIYPSVAISLTTLELLRCIRLYKASFSIEAYAKLVCYYYGVSVYLVCFGRKTVTSVLDPLSAYGAELHLRHVRHLSRHPTGGEEACYGCPRARSTGLAGTKLMSRLFLQGTSARLLFAYPLIHSR